MIAQEKFAEHGYTIVIYDAYRPYGVTVALYEKYKGSRYVASLGGSVHNRGAAVDMSLIDSKGRLAEMPSRVHTLNKYSERSSNQMYQISKWYMDYMEEVMIECGFNSIQSEWWHFNDIEYTNYRKMEYEIMQFIKVIFEEK
jgi:zinc D-Ala-D-Ala dipeptidase